MKTALKVIGIVLALSLLGSVMAYLAGLFETKIPVDFRGVMPPGHYDQVFAVEITTEPLIEQAPGTLRAKIETVISPLITATISSISVRAGDEVQQGAVLVELDSRELDARVDQAHQAVVAAQARLKQAEQDFQRAQKVLKADPGAISKAEIDRTQAALRAASAEFTRVRRQEDEAKTGLSYSTITAPISGRVVKRFAEPGDTAQQGVPLLRMYDPGSLRLEASVRESVASRLKRGQSITVKIDALDKEFPAVVDEIVPSADPGSRSFLVRVSLPDGSGLYPGMFGRLLVPVGQTERIYIPTKAVTRVGQLDFTIVKSEDGPARRYVRLGSHHREGQVEVITGLAPGDEILLNAQ